MEPPVRAVSLSKIVAGDLRRKHVRAGAARVARPTPAYAADPARPTPTYVADPARSTLAYAANSARSASAQVPAPRPLYGPNSITIKGKVHRTYTPLAHRLVLHLLLLARHLGVPP